MYWFDEQSHIMWQEDIPDMSKMAVMQEAEKRWHDPLYRAYMPDADGTYSVYTVDKWGDMQGFVHGKVSQSDSEMKD